MNIRLLFFTFLIITLLSCYEDPFFKLQVNVVDQSLTPIENVEVIVSVQDQNGVLIDSANVYKIDFTNSSGQVLFEFENLGFFAVETNKIVENNYEICGSASVGLEENTIKEITILTIESNCN